MLLDSDLCFSVHLATKAWVCPHWLAKLSLWGLVSEQKLDRTRKERLVFALENLVFDHEMKTDWLDKVSCVDRAVNPLRNVVVEFVHAASSYFVKGSVAAENHDQDNDWKEKKVPVW
jgi:hypothetical protein